MVLGGLLGRPRRRRPNHEGGGGGAVPAEDAAAAQRQPAAPGEGREAEELRHAVYLFLLLAGTVGLAVCSVAGQKHDVRWAGVWDARPRAAASGPVVHALFFNQPLDEVRRAAAA